MIEEKIRGTIRQSSSWRPFASGLVLALCVAASASGALDPMVPVNPDMTDAKTLAEELRSARERWGFRRFVLTGPHAANTQFNMADAEAYRRLGERIAEVRGNLAGTDVEIGWWLAPTLRQGRDAPGQHVVDWEGHVSDRCVRSIPVSRNG